jgi:hypothetical protein
MSMLWRESTAASRSVTAVMSTPATGPRRLPVMVGDDMSSSVLVVNFW